MTVGLIVNTKRKRKRKSVIEKEVCTA